MAVDQPNFAQSWPEVMDLITAAKYLGFHPVTLREWKRKGEGPPGRKIGHCWRFHKPTLDAWLAEPAQPRPPQTARLPGLIPSVGRKAYRNIGEDPKNLQRYLKALGLDKPPSDNKKPAGRK